MAAGVIGTLPEGEITPIHGENARYRRYTYKCPCGNRGAFNAADANIRTPKPLDAYGLQHTAGRYHTSAGYLTDLNHYIPTSNGIADCTCGRMLRIWPVKVTYNAAVKCSAKCVNATGPQCECSCRGKNHGGASSV